MSSLIEQAALRLQQLRQAGIEVPLDSGETAVAEPQPAPAAPTSPATQLKKALLSAAATPGPASRRIDLDFAALAAVGIITPDAPRTALADQFRVIKRPLIANAVGRGAASLKHANLIMVTSALAGEGKTFNSVNLAMSIAAELDHTVMLVDADVARPSVLRTLGLPMGPGLLDVLEGKVDLAGALLRTNIDKLTLLPSGTPHPKATELLASDAMKALLDDMATRYPDRIIIFDSPPLLLTTESRVLATHMGQIVMVVNAGQTSQADVTHALSTIESCPIRLMILNKARTDGPGGYGYGYGYGAYGYGHDHGGAEAPAETSAKPA